MSVALQISGVRKRFGQQEVLRGVDLTVPHGRITAVLGPSGGGKSTLLRIVAGFERADHGSIVIAGNDVTRLTPERRHVGVVPQEGALFPHLDVAGNIGFGLPRGAASAARVDEVLHLVGLQEYADRRPDQLSGGQQQRVALARALAPRPSIILLDEPFSSLDASLRAEVRDEVFDVLHATEATAILVTHDQQEALSVADEVAVLLDGRFAQVGTPSSLYEVPASLDVATFVGDAVVVDGHATGTTAATPLGTLELRIPCEGAVSIVLRPEQLSLSPDAPTTGSVVGSSYFGHDGLVRVRLDDGTHVACRVQAHRLPPRGDRVGVTVTGAAHAYART